MNYTLSYNHDPQLNCGIINFNDKYVLHRPERITNEKL